MNADRSSYGQNDRLGQPRRSRNASRSSRSSASRASQGSPNSRNPRYSRRASSAQGASSAPSASYTRSRTSSPASSSRRSFDPDAVKSSDFSIKDTKRPRISSASRGARDIDLVSVKSTRGADELSQDATSGRKSKKRTSASVSSSRRGGVDSGSMRQHGSSMSFDSDGKHPVHSHAKSKKGKKTTLVENVRSKTRRRKVGIVAAILCAILVVAVAVGVFAFFRTTDSNLALEDSNASEALVAATPGEPYYVLCVADLDNPATKALEEESQGYMLVRVDSASKTLTFVTVPSIISCKMSDNSTHSLTQARSIGGDAELVRSISSVCGIDINHFIYTNSAHIVSMIDLLGGIQIDITEEIDDPNAGNKVIFAGDQLLDGESVLQYLRATNVSGGFDTTVEHRVSLTVSVLDAALSNTGLGFANIVGDASRYIETDLSTSDLLSMGEALRPVGDLQVYSCIVPYYETRGTSTDDVVYQVSSDSWKSMRELIEAGQNPDSTGESIANVVPSEVSVEVRNGTQMTGAASKLGEILAGYGYDVIGVGNVPDATIYPETLIVFTNSEYEGAAQAIVAQLGCGRVVNGGDYYSSDAGVIAIIGLDYTPAV